MLETFMADLAGPLKHDCNISFPYGCFCKDVPTLLFSKVYVLNVCVCVFGSSGIDWSGSQGRNTTTLLSLCYSVQMRDGAYVRAAWKTHFQRRKSGFEKLKAHPPPLLICAADADIGYSVVKNPNQGEKGKKQWKSCLAFGQGAKI